MKITDVEIIVANIPQPGVMDESPAKLEASRLRTTMRGRPMAPDTSENSEIKAPQIVVIVVKTDSGLEGYGFGWGTKGGMRTAHTIAEVFRPELIGNDPLDRERLWHSAHRADRYGGLASFNSYGPLDVALWDIASKSASLPLYKLIGAYRDRIPAYASSPFMQSPEDYASLAIEAKLKGFTAFKLHPPGEPDLDIACCEAVRAAVGPEFVLMSDPVGGNYDHEDAVRVGRALEKLEYLWLEEPLYDHDIHGLEQLSRTLDIAICAGEWNSDFFSKINYLRSGAADIIRADVSWTGGITGSLKSAHIAEGFGVNCEMHMTVLSLMDVANLHVALAIKNCRYLELPFPDGATFGIKKPLEIDNEGYVQAPTDPGLGVEIDWNVINRNTVVRI
ncbi:uncharacterized protein METZ01_LOCUS126929 [marine metagenome]|uniref:Mandelate racemase/muconate lactonizing enzyme C-terminal domain-containing protein n=1 Tax=marine metagenome TaxID=408172 RepID=A0A381YAP9_9ZZZZ|nr:mandelate racemase [Candidatus Poribacteria bacterium]|tara:strand:- start:61 stop:1233 length:1173 start_codon:yes stop_codon:yes gene_type:complete